MTTRSLLATLLIVLSVAGAWAKTGHTYVMDIPVSSEKTVVFNVQEGKFILRGDPNIKVVRMSVSIDRFFLFRLGEQDILNKLIKVNRDDQKVTVATDIPKSLSSFGRAEYPIDFVITVPTTMSLQLQDTSGVVEISSLSGDVTIEDGSGTLTASRIAGNLQITKNTGDIRVDQIKGSTTIRSRSGQMHIDNVGRLDVPQSSGNLEVSQAESADIHNESGNVSVQDLKGSLTLHDGSGEIVVHDIGGPVDITDTSGQIRVSNTGGGVTISDTDGNVTVRHVPGLKVTRKTSGEVIVSRIKGPIDVPPNVKVKRK